MQFLADAGISPEVVASLRADGHDAVHLFHQGLHRLADNDVLRKAASEGRILLAHDLDFSRLISRSCTDEARVLFRSDCDK